MELKEIKTKIENEINKLKMLNEGKKLIRLQKSIDEMTLEEIVNEINARIIKYRKSNEVDYRLIDLVLTISKAAHEIKKIINIFIVIDAMESSDLKIKYLAEFSKYFDEDIIDDALYFDDDKVGIKGLAKNMADRDSKYIREKRINNIKRKINQFTSKLTTRKVINNNQTEENEHKGMILAEEKQNPLELEIKTDEEERVKREKKEFSEKAVSKLVSTNYDMIDWEKLFRRMDLDTIDSIKEELPQGLRGVVLYEYLKTTNSLYIVYSDEQKSKNIIEYILENIPKEVIINDYLSAKSYKMQSFYKSHFKDIIGNINLSDIRRYHTSTGEYISYDIIIDVFEEEKFSAEEYIEIAKYIKQEEKDSFYSSIGYRLSIEERLRLLNKADIDDNIKNYIYKSFASYIVIDEEKRKEKNELLKELLPQIKDEEIINMYKIQIAIENNDYNEVFELLKNYKGEIYFLNKNILLNFSNEQIAELYKISTNPDLRIELLQLSRRKRKKDIYDWYLDEQDDDELTEENEKIPEHILVNENNYLDYLKNIKSKKEYKTFTLYFYQYEKEVSFEKALELYSSMKVENEVQEIIKNEFLPSIMCRQASNIEDLRKIIDLNFSKDNIKSALDSIINNKDSLLTIDLIKDYIEVFEKIDDIKTRVELIDVVIDKYLYKRIFFR